MSTFHKAPLDVTAIADSVRREFAQVFSPIDHVKIDFQIAYGDVDEDSGEIISDALRHGGVKVLGLCKILSSKDRAHGLGDVRITVDGDWWKDASEEQKRALLDHEMFHIALPKKQPLDEHGRPKLKMRKHDWQFGWFKSVAARHGLHSLECQQAKLIFDHDGQSFFGFLQIGSLRVVNE